MSVAQFKHYAAKVQFTDPPPEWAVRWLMRLYEFYEQPLSVDFSFNTVQVVDFLKSMRDRGVPAWQRHQAALTAARYQMMLTGRMDVELGKVVQKLADLAHSERKGDLSQAAQETHYPANEPKVITALRQTLRRRRYKYDTEEAYFANFDTSR